MSSDKLIIIIIVLCDTNLFNKFVKLYIKKNNNNLKKKTYDKDKNRYSRGHTHYQKYNGKLFYIYKYYVYKFQKIHLNKEFKTKVYF